MNSKCISGNIRQWTSMVTTHTQVYEQKKRRDNVRQCTSMNRRRGARRCHDKRCGEAICFTISPLQKSSHPSEVTANQCNVQMLYFCRHPSPILNYQAPLPHSMPRRLHSPRTQLSAAALAAFSDGYFWFGPKQILSVDPGPPVPVRHIK